MQFYAAPSTDCALPGVFVIRGDSLIAYTAFKGWLSVAYIAADGRQVDGWVPENARLKYSGRIGLRE